VAKEICTASGQISQSLDKHNRRPKYAVLVGGLGCNKYIRELVKGEIGEGTEILSMESPRA
jgi:hypothetical protein